MKNREIPTRINKPRAQVSLLSFGSIVVIFLFIIALIAFILIARQVFIIKDIQFDYKVFDFLAAYVNKTNNAIMLFFTFLGTHLFLIPANLLLIAYFLFYRKNKWYSIKIPSIAISSLLVMTFLKLIFARHRPAVPLLNEARGFSFPSGHAFMSMTFYGFIIYMIIKSETKKWLKWVLSFLLFLLILFIGLTRIYLKVHYTSDVLAGFATGFSWLCISIFILNRIEKNSNRRPGPIVSSASVIKK